MIATQPTRQQTTHFPIHSSERKLQVVPPQAEFPLPPDLDPTHLPQHIAVIMDGNGRWARQQGLPRVAGHRQGAKTLKHLLHCCRDWGIQSLTAYAFSTENWQRPGPEVQFLLVLFEQIIEQELAEMQRAGVRIVFIGDLAALPDSLRLAIRRAEAITGNNRGIQLTVALNYGSRQELVHACQQLARQVERGKLSPREITAERLSQQLYTRDIPDPDLVIRTSGEVRLSNFLLWQLAYAELYFTDTLWPDFDSAALHQALCQYQQRDRRFGQLK